MNYLTCKDIQSILHLSPRQARTFLKTEGVPSIQIGAQFLIEENALKDYLKDNKTTILIYNKK